MIHSGIFSAPVGNNVHGLLKLMFNTCGSVKNEGKMAVKKKKKKKIIKLLFYSFFFLNMHFYINNLNSYII